VDHQVLVASTTPTQPEPQRLAFDARGLGAAALDLELLDARGARTSVLTSGSPLRTFPPRRSRRRGLEAQVGRHLQLAEADARKAIVSLPDLPAAPAGGPAEPVRRFAQVIDAFRPRE
jgi:hypothetical protein